MYQFYYLIDHFSFNFEWKYPDSFGFCALQFLVKVVHIIGNVREALLKVAAGAGGVHFYPRDVQLHQLSIHYFSELDRSLFSPPTKIAGVGWMNVRL